MPVIHLIRHAEPALRGVFLGSIDPQLADHSHAPSALDVEVVYMSPLRRSRETAALLFPRHVPVMVPELAECSFGDWEGKTWVEIQRLWPVLADRKVTDWRGVTPPNGESWEAFSARVARAWEIVRAGPFPAAVVAHGGTNSVLAHLAAGIDPLTFHQDYLEIFTHDIHD
jgi:broad specificity phosphatase PhoE